MPSRIRDYRTLPTDDYVIGVTGGSFALGVAKHAGQAIDTRIAYLFVEMPLARSSPTRYADVSNSWKPSSPKLKI